GIISTAAVNYDMTFNSIILNSISEDGVKEQNMRNGRICIFGKCTERTELLKKIAAYTILLTKWELVDDRNDHPGLRSNFAEMALGRAIRKAERMYPEYDEQVGKGFATLKRTEDEGSADPVNIGNVFASSLIPAMRDIAGSDWNDDLERMFTGLGTMIYVMDAVDDLDEDYMNGTFNPFLANGDGLINKKEFIRKNIYIITDIFGGVMKDVRSSYNAIREEMRFHQGVSDNIIYHGIPGSVKRILACGSCARPSLRNVISSRSSRREGKE
ncbi:MAG: DUF5685 family protein, partial [Methanomassiliicoccaceae archaeon]|nr:DUF5685 family protein [Methanomassiliicoccaceae archaeon]